MSRDVSDYIKAISYRSVLVEATAQTFREMGLEPDGATNKLTVVNQGDNAIYFDFGDPTLALPTANTPSSAILGSGDSHTFEMAFADLLRLKFGAPDGDSAMNVLQGGGG